MLIRRTRQGQQARGLGSRGGADRRRLRDAPTASELLRRRVGAALALILAKADGDMLRPAAAWATRSWLSRLRRQLRGGWEMWVVRKVHPHVWEVWKVWVVWEV